MNPLLSFDGKEAIQLGMEHNIVVYDKSILNKDNHPNTGVSIRLIRLMKSFMLENYNGNLTDIFVNSQHMTKLNRYNDVYIHGIPDEIFSSWQYFFENDLACVFINYAKHLAIGIDRGACGKDSVIFGCY